MDSINKYIYIYIACLDLKEKDATIISSFPGENCDANVGLTTTPNNNDPVSARLPVPLV